MKILLAEDEEDLRDVLSAMLEHNGYSVDAVPNGREAVELALKNTYDAMVLDVMMPEMDGIEAMRRIRESGDTTPALFLTAKVELNDKVEGLDAGADDYLTKPFAVAELMARIRSITRRHETYNTRESSSARIDLNGLVLDTERAELSFENSISLAVKEVKLMSLFMENPEMVFSTSDIYERVWAGEELSREVVWVYISFLRGKLESIGACASIEGEKNGDFRFCLNTPAGEDAKPGRREYA